MTKREALNAIINETANEEVKAWATAEIEKMDHANEARRNKVSKKAAENAPIIEAIKGILGAEPKTATMLIAEAGVELKPQAIPSLLKGLVAAGTIEKVDVKIKGKGTQKGYRIAAAE